MNDLRNFLNKFYDAKASDGDHAPAYVTDTKEDWIENFMSGELVDGCFIYADTMSVVTDPNDSCMISFFLIKDDFEYLYENLTLRFDRSKATLCGFSQNVDLWDYEDDLAYSIDEEDVLQFNFSKNMEKSVLKQLQKSLTRQFSDEMFKNHLDAAEKTQLQEFMKMSQDYLEYDIEYYNYSENEEFIKYYKLENEILLSDDGEMFKLKPNILVEFERTKEVFADEAVKEEKMQLLKDSFKHYVTKFLKSKDVEINFSVEGESSTDFGRLYLKFDEFEFTHSYLERQENASCYEDAPSSWTWAAWLIANNSPLSSDKFREDYKESCVLQALDQFVHTLDESDYFIELEKNLKDHSLI